MKLNDFMKTVLRATATGLLAMLLWGAIPVMAAEEALEEEPPPTSVDTSATSMDKSFGKAPGYGLQPKTLKEKLKDTSPFFRDTSLRVNLRSFYFYRDKYDHSKSEAWALGGAISYQSGYFLDRIGVGTTLYTSQPLYAPSDRDGTLLLQPGQDQYTVFGQLYTEIKVAKDVFIDLYRKEYNTPYMNKNDSRMIPNTFEGYTLLGTCGGEDGAPEIRYGGGYITKIKLRNEDRFQWMSEAVGASVERGVVVAGANYKQKDFSFGMIDYYSDDIINIFYAEGKYTRNITDRLGFLLAAQYSDQRSTGDKLLTVSSFDTNQVGIKGEMGFDGALMTLAYTVASSEATLRNPWSNYPGYTSVQVQDFNRAGEQAFMLRGAFDFSKVGLEGLTAYALWVHGWNRTDPGHVYNEDEYNIDIQWRAKDGLLKGLWPRFRYAHVDQRGGSSSSLNDVRVIMNYEIAVL